MNLVGISGKKQSGKNSLLNYLFGLLLISSEWSFRGRPVVIDSFEINDDGKVVVPTETDEGVVDKQLDLEIRNEQFESFLGMNIYPILKWYGFADKLKRTVISLFGLTIEQCYGTDEQKNSLTKYKWSNLPKAMFNSSMRNKYEIDESGYMTARQLLQWFGTHVMRRIYSDIWVESCIRQTQEECPELAIITDVRFPNEVEAIQKAGGKVVRLTRNTLQDDDETETALDDYEGFDYTLDNHEMSLKMQTRAFTDLLKDWGYMPSLMRNEFV